MRNGASRKDSILRRASILLDEYKFALKQAYFSTEKRTVMKASTSGTTSGAAQEVVEIMAQNEGMKSALKRLEDILAPFQSEENQDVIYCLQLLSL